MLTLFDTGGDPYTGITVPQEMFDKYYSKGWRPTPDKVKAGAYKVSAARTRSPIRRTTPAALPAHPARRRPRRHGAPTAD
ncbi:MAG: hypothetical protein EXQ97_02480 [Alphaproteobacteria bacterium]|nr:hypothetical protein [Alphaproteobacteria bacterium]